VSEHVYVRVTRAFARSFEEFNTQYDFSARLQCVLCSIHFDQTRNVECNNNRRTSITQTKLLHKGQCYNSHVVLAANLYA